MSESLRPDQLHPRSLVDLPTIIKGKDELIPTSFSHIQEEVRRNLQLALPDSLGYALGLISETEQWYKIDSRNKKPLVFFSSDHGSLANALGTVVINRDYNLITGALSPRALSLSGIMRVATPSAYHQRGVALQYAPNGKVIGADITVDDNEVPIPDPEKEGYLFQRYGYVIRHPKSNSDVQQMSGIITSRMLEMTNGHTLALHAGDPCMGTDQNGCLSFEGFYEEPFTDHIGVSILQTPNRVTIGQNPIGRAQGEPWSISFPASLPVFAQ